MTGDNWASMFEPRGPRQQAEPERAMPEPDDIELAPDMSVYRPWDLQRGGGPLVSLGFERYEPRSGLWTTDFVQYLMQSRAKLTGDGLLTLEYGQQTFIIEGRSLDELARQLQLGKVLRVREHAGSLWPAPPTGPWVKSIREIDGANGKGLG